MAAGGPVESMASWIDIRGLAWCKWTSIRPRWQYEAGIFEARGEWDIE